MALVIGVDSSTQSTKVEVREADDGRLIAAGRARHRDTTPPRSEQDPAIWWRALKAAIASAGRFDRKAVAAISVAGQQHGMVVLDAARKVIRPAKLWNDTESAPEAASLVRAIGARKWAKATGSVPVASFTITKLKWLKDHEPKSFARLRKVLLPHDWITFRLTGGFFTDRGDASGTLYWSPAEGRWRPDLLKLVDKSFAWGEALPKVLGPFEAAENAGGAAARSLGLHDRRIMVGPGTGDNMAAALGVGLKPGDIAISIGTSGTVYAVTKSPTADARGLVAGFADATGHFLPLVCTLNATKVSSAFARVLRVDLPTFDRMALSETPGAGGLILIPYLDGERTPNLPDATGSLVGVRSDITAAQIARAAIEGVVCGLLDGLDALEDAGVATQRGRMFLLGGGAHSRAYRRVLADLSRRALIVPEASEHVATGACVQAAAVFHGISPEKVGAAWKLGRGIIVEPDGRVDSGAVRAGYAAAAARVASAAGG